MRAGRTGACAWHSGQLSAQGRARTAEAAQEAPGAQGGRTGGAPPAPVPRSPDSGGRQRPSVPRGAPDRRAARGPWCPGPRAWRRPSGHPAATPRPRALRSRSAVRVPRTPWELRRFPRPGPHAVSEPRLLASEASGRLLLLGLPALGSLKSPGGYRAPKPGVTVLVRRQAGLREAQSWRGSVSGV